MMPIAVVVRKRADDRRHHIRCNRLIEDHGKSTVVSHAELPREAPSLDSSVVRRRIRRPPEPGGDREVRGGYGNRGSRDPISASVEVPREADFPRDDRRARYRPVVSTSREILLKSGARERLHIIRQEGIADGEGEPGGACSRAIRGLDAHDICTRWSAR